MLKLHAFQGKTFESLLTFWLVWVGLYYWIVSVSVGGPQAHIRPRQRWHGIVAAHEVHVRRNMEQLRRAVSDTGMRGTYYSSKSMLWFRLEMSSLFENELKVLKNEYLTMQLGKYLNTDNTQSRTFISCYLIWREVISKLSLYQTEQGTLYLRTISLFPFQTYDRDATIIF